MSGVREEGESADTPRFLGIVDHENNENTDMISPTSASSLPKSSFYSWKTEQLQEILKYLKDKCIMEDTPEEIKEIALKFELRDGQL